MPEMQDGRKGFPGGSCSGTNVSGVKNAGDGGIRSAFDDGAAVRKESHLVSVAPELEDKIIVLHAAVWLESRGHFAERDGTMSLMNLHGIASAKGDVRPAIPGEIGKLAQSASLTIRSQSCRGDL